MNSNDAYATNTRAAEADWEKSLRLFKAVERGEMLSPREYVSVEVYKIVNSTAGVTDLRKLKDKLGCPGHRLFHIWMGEQYYSADEATAIVHLLME